MKRKTQPKMSSQVAVGALCQLAKEYDIKECTATAGRRQASPAPITITTVLKDGSVISISRATHLQPHISEEQYGEVVLEVGRELLNKLMPVLAVRH